MSSNEAKTQWWMPVLTDATYFQRLREDYPDNAHMSDDELRIHFDAHGKYATTWDHTGDAYAEYEPLADSFFELVDALEDMLSGWRYIRHVHGDLYGVGWDRAQQKAEAALSRLKSPSST